VAKQVFQQGLSMPVKASSWISISEENDEPPSKKINLLAILAV
jgi:hypothetical protein